MNRILSQLLGTITILGNLCLWFGVSPTLAADEASTGPATEKAISPANSPQRIQGNSVRL